MTKKKYRRNGPEFKRQVLKRASEDGMTARESARILVSVNINFVIGEISADFWYKSLCCV